MPQYCVLQVSAKLVTSLPLKSMMWKYTVTVYTFYFVSAIQMGRPSRIGPSNPPPMKVPKLEAESRPTSPNSYSALSVNPASSLNVSAASPNAHNVITASSPGSSISAPALSAGSSKTAAPLRSARSSTLSLPQSTPSSLTVAPSLLSVAPSSSLSSHGLPQSSPSSLSVPGTHTSAAHSSPSSSLGLLLSAPGSLSSASSLSSTSPGSLAGAYASLSAPSLLSAKPSLSLLGSSQSASDSMLSAPGTSVSALDSSLSAPGSLLSAPGTPLSVPSASSSAPSSSSVLHLALSAPASFTSSQSSTLHAPTLLLNTPSSVSDHSVQFSLPLSTDQEVPAGSIPSLALTSQSLDQSPESAMMTRTSAVCATTLGGHGRVVGQSPNHQLGEDQGLNQQQRPRDDQSQSQKQNTGQGHILHQGQGQLSPVRPPAQTVVASELLVISKPNESEPFANYTVDVIIDTTCDNIVPIASDANGMEGNSSNAQSLVENMSKTEIVSNCTSRLMSSVPQNTIQSNEMHNTYTVSAPTQCLSEDIQGNVNANDSSSLPSGFSHEDEADEKNRKMFKYYPPGRSEPKLNSRLKHYFALPQKESEEDETSDQSEYFTELSPVSGKIHHESNTCDQRRSSNSNETYKKEKFTMLDQRPYLALKQSDEYESGKAGIAEEDVMYYQRQYVTQPSDVHSEIGVKQETIRMYDFEENDRYFTHSAYLSPITDVKNESNGTQSIGVDKTGDQSPRLAYQQDLSLQRYDITQLEKDMQEQKDLHSKLFSRNQHCDSAETALQRINNIFDTALKTSEIGNYYIYGSKITEALKAQRTKEPLISVSTTALTDLPGMSVEYWSQEIGTCTFLVHQCKNKKVSQVTHQTK